MEIYYFNGKLSPDAGKQLRENKGWFLILGIGLIALGALAIAYSLTSTLVTVTFIGIITAVFGIFEHVKAFTMSKWSDFFLHLFIGVLYLVGGTFMALNPTISALSLTMLLAVFFVVVGVLEIFFSLTTKLPNKFYALFNGILSVILGGMIWYQWPISGLWAIGTLIGVQAIATGWSWIVLSWYADKYAVESENYKTKSTE